MPIPWLIGLGVAAVAAAVLSDSEEEKQEKQREREREQEKEERREMRRIEREAERERETARAALEAEEARQRREKATSYACQHADSLITKFSLPGLSSGNIAELAMSNPDAARERLQSAFQQSPGIQAILSERAHAEAEQKDIMVLLKSLESIA